MYNRKSQREWTTARRICEQRMKKKWTQAKLAEEIAKVEGDCGQLKARTVSDWETGKNTPPLPRIQIIARLLDCDTAYLLGDGEDGQSLQAAVRITERTGLSDNAARKIAALKDGKEVAALSALIEWDGFEDFMLEIQNFTTFEAVANLEEYERALYEESKLDSQKAVKFYAQRSPSVSLDASLYSDMIQKSEKLMREELPDYNEHGSFLIYKTQKCVERFLEHVACKLLLDD